jgi:hypothetical protein
MPENLFDGRIAKSYEAKWPELFAPAVVDPAVSFLADLAGTGPALELGIGTGRLAIPLSQRGVRVHGIELSPDMIAELRAKPGTDSIDVTMGDFATTRVGGTFKVAYLVRNTITNLTTQDDQVECFRNAAAHLETTPLEDGGSPSDHSVRATPEAGFIGISRGGGRYRSRGRRVADREPRTRCGSPRPGSA